MRKFSDSGQRQDGLTLMDLQTLPAQDKQIINWLRQQGNCNLLDMAAHFCQDEETILARLDPLLKKGFIIQESGDNDVIYYQVKFAPKRPQKIPLKLIKGKVKEQPEEELEQEEQEG